MSIIRITDPDQLRPGHVVLICAVLATLAGNCLLTSGPHTEVLHDGAVDWPADSLLRAVVEVLNLQFGQTTSKGVDIKALVFGWGTALAMLTVAFTLGLRSKSGEDVAPEDTTIELEPAGGTDARPAAKAKTHIPLLAAAQVMTLAFLLWCAVSIAWSNAPDYAEGRVILVGIQLCWAFALGLGLNRAAARWAAWALLVVCAMTAGMAIAYRGVRNPTLRASYPIGNPLFLAACLIPGILLSLGVAAGAVESLVRQRRVGRLVPLLVCLVAAGAMLYAFYLTGSRGPLLGLLAGVGAMVFFAQGRRGRMIVGLGTAALLVLAAAYLWAQRDQYSTTGRSATIRARLYAWSYAFNLAVGAPLAGHGPGAFVLTGDAAAGQDALDDPLALGSRVSHAHCEWLETWCEVGSIGLVLVVGGLGLTLWAGAAALDRLRSSGQRWMLIALLASLVALVVEESGNSALRFPGLPGAYFTVIGLIWAMSASSSPGAAGRWRRWLRAVKSARVGAFVAVVALAAFTASMSAANFRGARAFYERQLALTNLEWDRALALAETAKRVRLDPFDRLSSASGLCATYLDIARAEQLTSFRQAAEAQKADPPDARLSVLAEESRKRSVLTVQAGLSELGDLLKASPSAWDAGFLEHGFYRVLADFDAALGRTADQERNLAAAVAALEREIARRPFDPKLAANYAYAQPREVNLAHLLDVLARPLRHNATPPTYLDLLTELSSDPAFDGAFASIHQRIMQVTPEMPVDQWPDPWAPEKLRLAAMIQFTRGEPAAAELELATAAPLYDLIRQDAPLGAAACYAELADARCFAHMDDPAGAVEAAHRAIDIAPDSEQGRTLIQTVRRRIVTYVLTAGDEDQARRLLVETDAGASPRAIDEELGVRYSQMAHGAYYRSPDSLPRGFPRWVERALELNPAYEAGWQDSELVQVLSRALQLGADMRLILEYVEDLLTRSPESTAFRDLARQLREVLGLPVEPAPATQPAAEQQPTTAPGGAGNPPS